MQEGNSEKYCLRYTLVRYEDLVDKMEEMVRSLYGRLGLLWTEEIRWAPQAWASNYNRLLKEHSEVPHRGIPFEEPR